MTRIPDVYGRVYEFVERAIILVLLVMLTIVVLWATGVYSLSLLQVLGARLFGGQIATEATVYGIFERIGMLHEVFGGFLLILIGVELMKTVAMYLSNHEMHVEVVFTVAIIAIARHTIDLDLRNLEGIQLVGLGVLLIALAVGYYFFRKAATLPIHPGHDA
jgi:uncharacterized membrane protein (DUF373 family)